MKDKIQQIFDAIRKEAETRQNAFKEGVVEDFNETDRARIESKTKNQANKWIKESAFFAYRSA